MTLPDDLRRQIDDLVRSNELVLFMKGTKRFPQCGFSAQVVQILDRLGASYRDVNVLADPALRDGIKAYSDWPTIPQLYVKGQFVGGCDIVKEMNQNGELAKLVGAAEPPPPAKPPTIRLTDGAAAAIREATEPGSDDVLRFAILPGYRYDLSFGPREKGDVVVKASGVEIAMDRATAAIADDTSISFVDGPNGGFKIANPNAPTQVQQISPAELKAMMDKGEAFELFDVRTDAERAIATIPGAKPFSPAAVEALPKETTLVFHCHHGGRSQAAAERFAAQGFKKVYNVRGGIDAWSATVDPAVKRY